MVLVAAFDTFGTFARLADRQARNTAARNLARVLLAEAVSGEDRVQGLSWRATAEHLSVNLLRRDLSISSPNGPVLTIAEFDLPVPAR